MSTPKNAARVAVEAAAFSESTHVQPKDVFDCIAAAIPRNQWEAALDHDDARKWNEWLGYEAKQPSMLEKHDLELQAARQAQSEERIKDGIFDLEERVWRLESACSALGAVWQLTDGCAFRSGDTLDLPAQDMANLLKSVHAEIARRTEEINVIAKALHNAWKEKA